MRRARFLCTAICAFAICGLMLTGCEKGNENTVSETEIPETTAASESVSKTTQTEAETITEITEAEEMKEYDPVPESTLNYDKIKDRVIFEDGTQKLTAGEYIDAFINGTDDYVSFYYGVQIMDMDKNGIPEFLLYHYSSSISGSILYTVTADGELLKIPVTGDPYHEIDGKIHYGINGGRLTPYEKDGETIWTGGFFSSGTGGSGGDSYVLKYDGSGVVMEVVDSWKSLKSNMLYDENGDVYWEYYDYFYIFGEEVTEEEFDRRSQEYDESLHTSDAVYAESHYDIGERTTECEFREIFSYTLNRYLDMLDGVDKDIYAELADKKIGDITAQEYIEAVMACEDFTEFYSNGIQLADLNGDGMPEIIAYYDQDWLTNAEYFSVSKDKTATLIPAERSALNDQVRAEKANLNIGRWVKGYKNDSGTIWVGNFMNWDTPYGSDTEKIFGNYILKYDGKTVSQEILREYYDNKGGDKYYWNDKKVTEKEYEQLYRKFIWDMEPLTDTNLYVSKCICNQDMEQKDLLAAAVLEYIEKSYE